MSEHRTIADGLTKRRVAIYARVSTKDQEPLNQLLELRHYAELRGWTVVAEHVDHGISGSKDHRPALQKLMEAAQKRAIDVVLVSRFDRFARSVRHLVAALEQFRALGISFVSYHENLDTTTPTGQVMFHIVAAISQFEKELLRERIFSGLRRARAQGKVLGRPRIEVDAERVRALRGQGLSLRSIARTTGLNKDAIRRTLGLRK